MPEGEACSFPVMAGRKGKWESINAMLASLDLKIGTNNYGWVGVEFFNNQQLPCSFHTSEGCSSSHSQLNLGFFEMVVADSRERTQAYVIYNVQTKRTDLDEI